MYAGYSGMGLSRSCLEAEGGGLQVEGLSDDAVSFLKSCSSHFAWFLRLGLMSVGGGGRCGYTGNMIKICFKNFFSRLKKRKG